jgi:hypothetical protein
MKHVQCHKIWLYSQQQWSCLVLPHTGPNPFHMVHKIPRPEYLATLVLNTFVDNASENKLSCHLLTDKKIVVFHQYKL